MINNWEDGVRYGLWAKEFYCGKGFYICVYHKGLEIKYEENYGGVDDTTNLTFKLYHLR